VNRRARELIAAQPRPVRTITVDNGGEFHGYAARERVVDARFYFATASRVGAGQQREREWPPTPIPAEGREHGASHARTLRPTRDQTESSPSETLALPNAGGMLCPLNPPCCTSHLNPPLLTTNAFT
jgi:hypothetical protein